MAMMTGDSFKTLRRVAAVGLAACVLSVVMVRQTAAQDKPADPPPPPPDPDKVTLNFFREHGDWRPRRRVLAVQLEQGAAFRIRPSTSCTTPSTSAWPSSGSPRRRPPTRRSATRFARRSDPRPTSWRRPPASSSRNRPTRTSKKRIGSYLAPVGKGLQIDVGKFVTNAGAEVIEAKDDFNYSRSLLFQLAIPLYHSGVRLTYSPNDKVTLMGGVINGWNDVNDNNTGKSVMASVTFKPTGSVSIIENYIGGPEQPNDNSNWRTLSDTVLSYTVNPTGDPDGQLRLRPRHERGRRLQCPLAGRRGLPEVPGEQVRRARFRASSTTTTRAASRRVSCRT